jgi:hypothetical protein
MRIPQSSTRRRHLRLTVSGMGAAVGADTRSPSNIRHFAERPAHHGGPACAHECCGPTAPSEHPQAPDVDPAEAPRRRRADGVREPCAHESEPAGAHHEWSVRYPSELPRAGSTAIGSQTPTQSLILSMAHKGPSLEATNASMAGSRMTREAADQNRVPRGS